MAEWVMRCAAKIKPFWQSEAKWWTGLGFVFGFVFACTPHAVAPLGTGCAAAFFMAGQPLGALIGSLCGAWIAASYPQTLALLLYAIGVCIVYARGKAIRAADKLLLLCVCWSAALPLFYFGHPDLLMTGLANLSLSLCAAVCMAGGIRATRSLLQRRVPAVSSQLALWLCCALLLYALTPLQYEKFSLPSAAACLFILLSACMQGVETVAVGVLLASACVLGGAGTEFAGSLAFCALGVAGARALGKWGIAGALVVCAFLMSSFITPALRLAEASTAACVFVCLPRRFLRALSVDAAERARTEAELALSALRGQLMDAANVLREAAPLFESADGFAQRQMLAVSNALISLSQGRAAARRRYDVAIGAAAIPKAGSHETGDSMGMRQIDGKLALLLSDGMGSGHAAHGESAAAIALFGDLLSIGFALAEALECVNRLLMRRAADADMFATMDALLFDLSKGRAQFIKYGAPPSYILRGGSVHTLYAEALPAGIVKEARPALHEAALQRGDTVVLMTDGAYEALGAELTRSLLEDVGGANTADDAAQALLARAREKSGADDMSVIVARIA
ncbi:MAG: SpoIIE family protein phosphatase [Clostridia bacterium]|nr:SpoIIE family protein phosphatase [Clostridia bacterium]